MALRLRPQRGSQRFPDHAATLARVWRGGFGLSEDRNRSGATPIAQALLWRGGFGLSEDRNKQWGGATPKAGGWRGGFGLSEDRNDPELRVLGRIMGPCCYLRGLIV